MMRLFRILSMLTFVLGVVVFLLPDSYKRSLRELWTRLPADDVTAVLDSEWATSMTEQVSWLPGTDGPGVSGKQTPVVRWRDEQGVWHFTQEAPSDVAYETIWIDPDANLVQGFELPEAASAPLPPDTPSRLQSDVQALRTQSEVRVRELERVRAAASP